MSPPRAIEPADHHGSIKGKQSHLSDTILPKNKSTSNLLSNYSRPGLNIPRTRARYSLDVDAANFDESESFGKSPIIPEHAGEHGLGLSGLRRIRQQPVTPKDNGTPFAPLSRSTSITLSPDVSRRPSTTIGPPGVPLNLTGIEDLTRFPSESLHSFSFTHQSEESIHNRQNVLKRSMDFMRDKLGWNASNPGLVAAQAKLSGDHEVQSMMELLSRAHLIGQDANNAHGLGLHAPLTGPADVAGNVFEQSFTGVRSSSPDQMNDEVSPRNSMHEADRVLSTLAARTEESTRITGETTLDSISKALNDNDGEREAVPSRPRTLLKRTLTNTDDLSLQLKLTDALAQPYTIHEEQTPPNSYSVKKHANLPPLHVPTPIGQPLNHPHSAAPHGHGSRWAPAAQAIFMTESNSPWTITSANDLACLVFGVTNAEVRKLGILEVVKEERRKWLEDKLKDPDAGSLRSKVPTSQSQRSSPNSTTSLNVGSGLTARLLSKPPQRNGRSAKRRVQSDDGAGSSYASRSKVKGGLNHSAQKSRGVLLCGEVVPIRKRNGDVGSASLWVKEKKGGLIWVLEEISEDVATLSLDEVGCVMAANGAIEHIWGCERIRRGMDIKRLIPAIPRRAGTNTGALDNQIIFDTRTFTARAVNDISIPVTVESLPSENSFRVSSFPHMAGIIVLNSQNLRIISSNTVFSSALFGQSNPDGLHITDILPNFDRLLHLMTDEDNISLVDGIVIPEHSFRRARALLAMREGKSDAAAVFLRPSGLLARHRDGSDIMVDVQMRVVKSEKSNNNENVIDEVDESMPDAAVPSLTEDVYALWITYSRHLHTSHHIDGAIPAQASRSPTPCEQPAPGQLESGEGLGISSAPDSPEPVQQKPLSLLTEQLKAETSTSTITRTSSNTSSAATPPSPEEHQPAAKKTINDFLVLEEMGQGAYGQVKLCRYKKPPGNKMVIKYVTKKRILVDTWTRDRRLGTVPLEIHVLDYLRRDDLRHPNIVQMADFFEDDVNYYIEMVPHGLPGMDLFDYIELRTNMDENEARRIFVQVAEAVHHLHVKASVVHRDIKDENVILDGDQNIKLIDFGSAAYIKNGPFDVFVGTIDYAAPEVLAGNPYRGKEQDVWALGILLYTIIYKENPFYSIDEIMDHDLRVPYIMSDASIDLVRRMLNRDVEVRATIGEVLEHEWCRGVGRDD